MIHTKGVDGQKLHLTIFLFKRQEEHICYFIICAMMNVWLAAQFCILFGDKTCVVCTSRVRSLIKFLRLWISSVEIYINFFCPRRRPCTVVCRKCVCVGGGFVELELCSCLSPQICAIYTRGSASSSTLSRIFLQKFQVVYLVRIFEI
jgi:hypothetical protein